jgi:23S rRNA pseudouridine1911/1915/1917 synthase
VHLSSIGHPVVGDDTYGGGGGRKLLGLPAQRHFLHAAWLRFSHPVSQQPMEFRSPLHRDLDRALRIAAGDDFVMPDGDLLEYLGFFNE